MGIATRFSLFQILIILPFVVGMVIRNRFNLRNPAGFTKKIIRVNLVIIEPVIALWCTWGLVLNRELILLPLFGLFLVLSGLVCGGLFQRLLGLSGKKGATFLIHATLANHGFTMGAFLCYLLIGEQGLGLAILLLVYFLPFAFLVVFPYASKQSTGRRFDLASVVDFFLNLQNLPILAVGLSLFFLSLGWERPALFVPIDLFIIVSLALYYFTLGVNFVLPAFFASGRENAALAAIKFLLVPAIALLVLKVLHLDPAIETVILVESFMPAAVYSVVTSVLFDLDASLASNLFVWNTILFLVVVLPVLFLFRTGFLGLLV